MDKTELLQWLINQSKSTVFFGGAGVSTESGIPDFRSRDGLYNQQYEYPPERIISHEFFYSHTEEFYRFYRNKMLHVNAQPNAAHLFLARAEMAGKLDCVITQNIDGLHQAAGSKRVWELHGSVHKNHCTRCNKSYSLDYITGCNGIPRCKCGGIIKPDVVLYGEGLSAPVLDGAIAAIERADLLIVGGTSLAVYPAAGLLNYFKGKHLIVVNKSPTPTDAVAELVVNLPIGEVFSKLIV